MKLDDLFGLPWDVANCAAVVAEVVRRAGRPCPWLDEWAHGYGMDQPGTPE